MTELDDRLKRFLDASDSEREAGVTLRSVAVAQQRLTDAFVAHEQKCDIRWAAYGGEAKSVRMRTENLERAVTDLEHQEEDTGSHIIKLAGEVGEVKGIASRPRSLPPVLKIVNYLGSTLAEKGASHAVVAIVAIACAYVAHLLHVYK